MLGLSETKGITRPTSKREWFNERGCRRKQYNEPQRHSSGVEGSSRGTHGTHIMMIELPVVVSLEQHFQN